MEAASEKFKEFERKDAQLQMDIKHTKTKLKKVEAKIDSDAANIKVRQTLGQGLDGVWVWGKPGGWDVAGG